MLSHLTSDRWVAAALTGLLCLTVMGCGYDDYRERAYESAAQQLPESVAESVACVTQTASRLLADPSTPSLQETLSDCAGTAILNQAVPPYPPGGIAGGPIAVMGVVEGGELELTFFTEVSGTAEAGVSSARVNLATCWRIVFDDGPKQPKEITDAPCDEGVIAYFRPTELVPFEDLELPQH